MNISPNYRNDPQDEIDPRVRDYLDKEYFAKLPNRDVSNKKMLVVFAGGNAVGKSVLSQKIARDLKGLRLENDAVKRALIAKWPNIERTKEIHNVTWQYTMGLYARLDSLTTNGLIVRDGIITWYYDRILPIFIERGYELFIIGYDLSEAKMRELIHTRGDTPTSTEQRFYELIQDQQIHMKRFFEHYSADILLNDDTVFDHDSVISEIRNKLAAS